MSPSPALHPSVRERPTPRLSATALAEYLILRPDEQDQVLHDSKFSRPPIVAAYADAYEPLITYNQDIRRPASLLEAAKLALSAKSLDPALRPKARDEARRCLEVIELFELNENSLGLGKLPLSKPPKFNEMNIEGVSVSIRPHFLVDATGTKGRQRIGAGLLRLAKAPDPAACKLEETRRARGDHRREMARYLVAMLQMLLEQQWPEPQKVDRDLCFVADLRLGERIGPASDQAARLKSIKAACGQIARLWSTVTPSASILLK